MNTADCENAPMISLGGLTYSVPPIPFRIASKIVPKILAKPNLETEEGFLDVAKIIFTGLSASNTNLKYEDFIEGCYTIDEILKALTVIGAQAGLKKDKGLGEATGDKSPLISKS